jgi:hypothetical protein
VLAQEFTALEHSQRARGPLARLIAGIRAFGDEALVAAEYVAEARLAHHVLIVFAPGSERTSRELAIVARNQAHIVHYYSHWIIRGMVCKREESCFRPMI